MAGVSATATSSLVTAKVRYQAVAILASTADTHAMQPLTALGDSLPFPRREAQPYLTGSVRRVGTQPELIRVPHDVGRRYTWSGPRYGPRPRQ